jgi:NAD(P)-dependent dehydrogenase (short-subunit alcohol dehydrogenase family)
MKRQASGSIISTAGVAGMQAGCGGHVHGAARAGVIQLPCNVAMEPGETGVRVNCICSGSIATPIFGQALGLDDDEVDRTLEVVKAALACQRRFCPRPQARSRGRRLLPSGPDLPQPSKSRAQAAPSPGILPFTKQRKLVDGGARRDGGRADPV